MGRSGVLLRRPASVLDQHGPRARRDGFRPAEVRFAELLVPRKVVVLSRHEQLSFGARAKVTLRSSAMLLRRTASTLFVVGAVSALVTACAATTSSGGATGSSSCADLSSAAQKDVAAVVDAHRACTQASDCTSVALSASCFDSCTRSFRKDAAAAFKTAQDKADATQCAQFKTQGCKVIVPPCVPPSSVACVGGECTGG